MDDMHFSFKIENPPAWLPIGRTAENDWRTIEIDCSYWFNMDASGNVVLMYRPNCGMAPYPLLIERDGDNIVWHPKSGELVEGVGQMQAFFYVGESKIGSSEMVSCEVDGSLLGSDPGTGPGAVAPPWAIDIIEQIAELSGHYPKIIDGDLYIWDSTLNEWVEFEASGGGSSTVIVTIDDTTDPMTASMNATQIKAAVDRGERVVLSVDGFEIPYQAYFGSVAVFSTVLDEEAGNPTCITLNITTGGTLIPSTSPIALVTDIPTQQQMAAAAPVQSVNGQTGAVTIPIPSVPQMATAADMSDWTSGKTVDAAVLKSDFRGALSELDDVQGEVARKANASDIPTAVSELTNDSGYQTASDLAYATPEQFGAKGDGETDDTTSIQAAVDSGKNVRFGYGKTYKCGTIDVTKNIEIDCRWSEFICTGEKLFYCHGSIIESIAGSDYVADTIYTLPNGDNYSGMCFLRSATNVNPTRTYYYGGFAAMFGNGLSWETCPVGFAGVTVDKIKPVTCKIENLGLVLHPNNQNLNYTIFCEYGLNCTFENIQHDGEKYQVVGILKSYGCTVSKLVANVTYSGNIGNYYPVGINSATKTTVKDSSIFSASWAAVDTGGNFCNLDTTIKNCELHVSVSGTAYGDHNNSYRTIIENSVIDSCNVGALATVRNTTITANHASNSTAYNCMIHLEPTPITGINRFTVENVIFDYGGFTSLPNSGIQVYCTAQEGTHMFFLDSLVVRHIRTTAAKTGVTFNTANAGVSGLQVNGGIILDDVQGGFALSSASDALTTYSAQSFMSVINCLERDKEYTGMRGVTQIGQTNLKMPPYVYIRNCVLYRIAGIISRLEMTDVEITNNSAGHLSASIMYCINVSGNLNIADITSCSYAEFCRCRLAGAYWALGVVKPAYKKYATYSSDGLAWNDMSV